MYWLYSFLLTIGFVILSPRFLWDAVTKGKYAAGFWQRFGFLPAFEPENKRIIWLHCVSVGETNAAKPIVAAIRREFPEFQIVVSTTTKTGQTLARDIFKNDAKLIFYFPFDWVFVVRRVLRVIKPEIVLIMETELWFNFLREAKRQNVKIALVNGRISEKSFRNYKLIRSLMHSVLNNLDAALMSADADAGRIKQLGCAGEKVFVTGNVKFDLEISAESALTAEFRRRFDSGTPFVVAASTHEPEEQIILAAWRKLIDEKNVVCSLIIAPRHPERFDSVTEIVKKNGFNLVRRSAGESNNDRRADVILLDSVGELRAILPLGEIVFVGGSLIPHGGQNVLEPAAANKAIVTGFYTHNFAAIIKILREKNAVVQLPPDVDSIQLAETFADLLLNENRRATLAANALAVVRENAGATAKTIAKLRDLI